MGTFYREPENMAVSIGIDYAPGQWRCCSVDQGQLLEMRTFSAANEALAWIGQPGARYPESTIMLALDASLPLHALAQLTDEQLVRLAQSYPSVPEFAECQEVLCSLRALNSRCYCAPSVVYLPTVPPYRRLLRSALGSARDVCAIVTLLHHMREQGASWQEMNFLYVHASEQGTTVVVLQDGQIVNGLGLLPGSSLAAARAHLSALETTEQVVGGNQVHIGEQLFQAAFWEGLLQELAGLLATHHIEDIVLRGSGNDQLMERLAETYQVYLYPYAQSDREGYEVALGAALLGAQLDPRSPASDVMQHLHILQAGPLVRFPE